MVLPLFNAQGIPKAASHQAFPLDEKSHSMTVERDDYGF
jgi:hypothetical protein